MKILTKATTILDGAINALAFLAAVLIVFIMLSVSVEVFGRSIVGHSVLEWVLEISEYSLLYILFLGTAWVLRKDKHVKMDLVLNLLNRKAQTSLNVITSSLGTIVCLILTWYGIRVTWQHFLSGYFYFTLLEIPRWPILAIIPVGSLLLFIQFIRRTRGYLKKRPMDTS